MTDNNEETSTEELTLQANATRSRLLRTVEQLDRKRHDVLDVKKQIKEHVAPVAVTGGLIVVGLGAFVGLAIFRALHAAERRRAERKKMIFRLWNHPERAARKQPTSFLGQLFRSVALGVLSAVIMLPARRALAGILDAADPRKRAVLPPAR
jgi:hypothetical protein